MTLVYLSASWKEGKALHKKPDRTSMQKDVDAST